MLIYTCWAPSLRCFVYSSTKKKNKSQNHSRLDYENVVFWWSIWAAHLGEFLLPAQYQVLALFCIMWWFLKMYSAFAFYYLGSLASILLCNVISEAWCSTSQCDIISQTEHAVGKKLISQSCGIITDTGKSDGFPGCFKGLKCSGWTLNWEHWRVI